MQAGNWRKLGGVRERKEGDRRERRRKRRGRNEEMIGEGKDRRQ